nr:MAG TPA: hypothetical protein [Caudoviricetes sp.]
MCSSYWLSGKTDHGRALVPCNKSAQGSSPEFFLKNKSHTHHKTQIRGMSSQHLSQVTVSI